MSGGSSHARNLVNGARSVFASGESAMGRKLLARALALDPGDPDALWLDGEARRVAGDLGAARDAYERLLSIEPGHAGAACALALVADEAAQVAWRAGEAARAEGDLAAALAAYRDALAQNPADGLAAYAAAYLANEPPPPPPPPVARPVAYVCIEGFLPAGRRDEVLELTMRDAECFGPAMLSVGRTYDANIRQAEFIDRLTQGDVKHWFLPLVATRLPQVAARLGAGALAPTGVELQMTAHHDGAFFTAHRDAEAAAPPGQLRLLLPLAAPAVRRRRPAALRHGALRRTRPDPAGGRRQRDRLLPQRCAARGHARALRGRRLQERALHPQRLDPRRLRGL